jgi:hypothetical protein
VARSANSVHRNARSRHCFGSVPMGVTVYARTLVDESMLNRFLAKRRRQEGEPPARVFGSAETGSRPLRS